MAITYTPIATQTLGTTAASVTFSSISGAYTDLILVCSIIKTNASNTVFRLNSDTSSNYSQTALAGNGTTVYSSRNSNAAQGIIDYSDSTTNPVPSVTHFMNYSNTSTFKTAIARSGLDYVITYVNLWRSTSAINTIYLYSAPGSFASGSTFTLYGIKAA
jgi:hypothetical protein